MAHEGIHRFENLPTIGIKAIESAGAGKVFDLPLVHHAVIEPPSEIERRFEKPFLLSLSDNCLHRCRADILQCSQGITDRALAIIHPLHCEIHFRPIDVRRQQRDAHTVEFGAEQAKFVGIAHILAH